jgi:hypothetical protein
LLVQNEHHKVQDQHNTASTLTAVDTVTKAAITAPSETNGSTTAKGKWNPTKQARFAPYSGLNIGNPNIPPFWGQLVAAASDNKEAVVHQALLLNKLADKHHCFQSWLPPPHFLEDV